MLKRLPLLLSFIVILKFNGISQTIIGTVIEGNKNETMPFVTVSVVGTTNAVTTDMNGNFTLQNVSPSDSLLFSFVGYMPRKIKIGSQQTLSVKLFPDTKQLGEVVVTALGVTRQKREIGYSTEKINGDELKRSNSPNIINALSGKSAGVQIANPDGVDGGTTRITIRGNNNISGDNQPLIVVDGIPLSNDPGMVGIGRGQDWGSAINNINMSDVEDINILKGGAASALYGARGANGVVLITMKKGKKQKGLGVNYNMSYKTTHPYRYRDVQNTYGGGAPSTSAAIPELIIGSDGIAQFPILGTDAQFGYPGTAVSWGPKFNDQPVKWWDGSIRPWSAQPDNLKIPYRDGQTLNHNVSVEGGGDFGSMRISISRIDNIPIIDNSNFDQTTINTNSNIKVSDKVQIGLSASYIDYNRLNSPILGESELSYTKANLYSWPRSYQGEDLATFQLADGTQNPMEGYPYVYVDKYLWWKYYNNNTTLDRNKLIGGLTLNYAVTPWLSVMGRTGIDLTNDEYVIKHKPVDLIGLKDGYYGENNQRDRSLNSEFLITATKEKIFKSNFNLSVNIGGSHWDRNMHGLNAHSGTWYYPNWYSLENYTTYNPNTGVLGDILYSTNSFYRKRINSLYSFVNLSYKNYLFVEVTGRNDWSSVLPSDANSYFYPGISASYVVTDAFKLNSKHLNFLKFRGGASQTATDTDPYRTEFYYKTALFGGDQSSTFPNIIPPIALKPQRVNAFEAGTNIGLWDDRVTIDFTYYYKYSFDQILDSLPAPKSAGAPYVATNDGILTNKGFEFIINATVLKKNNLTFKTGINFARNKNKVVKISEEVDTYILADIWGENGPQMALHEGDDFGSIVGWDYVYKDGQKVVSDDGTKYEITETRVPIGNASPHFIAGWTTEFKYKNFTLSTLIDTKWGGDMYAGSYVIGLQTGQSPETLEERDGGGLPYTDAQGITSNTGVILEGVHADGTPNTTVVSYIYKYMPNAGGWGHFISKPGVVENTWVKFREITLSYNLSENLVKRTKIFQGLSFSITARDLFYIYTTIPDNINPEGYLGAGDAQGFEWGSFPGVRSLSFGINAKF